MLRRQKSSKIEVVAPEEEEEEVDTRVSNRFHKFLIFEREKILAFSQSRPPCVYQKIQCWLYVFCVVYWYNNRLIIWTEYVFLPFKAYWSRDAPTV